jgi:LemA protein
MVAVWVVIGVVVLLAVVLMWAFNGLVRRRNRTQEAWSEIDVELKRRHDLIPNLVETVKGYAAHERQTFEAVTSARAGAVSAGATGDRAQIAAAENTLTQALRSLFAVAENYPQLRAVEPFVQLQEQVTATEDKIEFARRYYNTSARDYNIAIQTFPRNVISGAFGFRSVAFFETPETERAVPAIHFTTPGATDGPAGS